MSWTDRKSTEIILKLRDQFKVDTFYETGTYKGVNIKYYAPHFDNLWSCEINPSYISYAIEKVNSLPNLGHVHLIKKVSPLALKHFVKMYNEDKRTDIVLFYLDAHFYDPTIPKRDRFVVLQELQALKGFSNCIIVIHDFANGLFGHITYDGQPLNLELLKDDLLKVNKNFKFYTNTECDIVNKEKIASGQFNNLELDEEMISTLDFIWSKPEKTYRGILYAVPEEVTIDGLATVG